ncbi:O-antigen ligase family protein, partial [Candidatus Parcubacteria bacterium]|nr:O-antigen ligase family protein [Candidatus Parcubacteria bacterium]
MLLFLIIYFLIFAFIAYRSLAAAIAVIVAFLPSYLIRFQVWIFPTTVLEGMVLIVFFIWFAKFGWKKIACRFKNKNFFQPYPFYKQVILIIAVSYFSIFIAPDFYKAAGLWRAYFLEPIFFFLIFVNVVKTKKDLRKIFFSLGISALLISLFAVYQKITGNFIPLEMWRDASARRVTSFYTSPNAVGLFLAPIIIIYFAWFFDNFKKEKLLLNFYKILVLLFSLATVVFTVSEGAWLGLSAAFAVFLYLSLRGNFISCLCEEPNEHSERERRSNLINKQLKVFSLSNGIASSATASSQRQSNKIKKLFCKIIVIIIFLSIIASLCFSNLIKDKIQPVLSDAANQNRFVLWQESWNFLTQNPKNFIFGAGIFGFPQIQKKFRDPLKMEPLIYPHNIFLNFWMEIGLIGMLAFIWLIFNFFIKTKKILKSGQRMLAIGLISAMISVIVHGLVDVPYF